MNNDPSQAAAYFKGSFLTTPLSIRQKLFAVKAFVFDWDGVFNSGYKDENGSSPFSEIDSMGTNLLRFNHYLRTNHPPLTAIISGEKNKAAFTFATREHFDAVYYKMADKNQALEHFCRHYSLRPAEIAVVFDDVPDFALATSCGIRIMVSRDANPLLLDFAGRNQLADYITHAQSGRYAVREAAEMLTGISGRYDDTIKNRFEFSPVYQEYLALRNKPAPVFYTNIASTVTEQIPS